MLALVTNWLLPACSLTLWQWGVARGSAGDCVQDLRQQGVTRYRTRLESSNGFGFQMDSILRLKQPVQKLIFLRMDKHPPMAAVEGERWRSYSGFVDSAGCRANWGVRVFRIHPSY
jgi:hypothetical protein